MYTIDDIENLTCFARVALSTICIEDCLDNIKTEQEIFSSMNQMVSDL